MTSTFSAQWTSVNAAVLPLLDALIADAKALQIGVSQLENGTQIVDAGLLHRGGLEAGRRIGEICMGGLGTVTLGTHSGFEAWPWSVTVHAKTPVLSCLGAQYAGWSLSHKAEASSFYALGSGPARAVAARETLFQELGYQDTAQRSVLVLEVDQIPPLAIADKIATQCGIAPDALTLIVTPTVSLAGVMQIASRVLEVAMHKAHTLHFDLAHIVDGLASTPVAPPGGDFMTAMGRTNDAILYGGFVHLFVEGEKEAAAALAKAMPSASSSDYGRPFAQIFKSYEYDFFKIDPMLFSPARVLVTHTPSGETFAAGQYHPTLLAESFGL